MKTARRASGKDLDWQRIHARLAQTATIMRDASQPSPERAALLLEERARRLASPSAPGRPLSATLDLLEFRLTGERYGIETRYVQEVVRANGLAPVPGVPELVAGIANLRGQILVVFNLRPLFGLAPKDMTDASRIVVCGDSQADLGLLVDSVQHIARLSVDGLRSEVACDGINARTLIRAVTSDAMIVLEGAALLADQRLFIDQARRQ